MEETTYTKNQDGTVQIMVSPAPIIRVVKSDDLIKDLGQALKDAKMDVDIKQEELAKAKTKLAGIKTQMAALTAAGVPVSE